MRRILYLGLDPPPNRKNAEYVHCPMIRIVARPDVEESLSCWHLYSHIIVTSKSAARILAAHGCCFKGKQAIAVGEATASLLPCSAAIPETATAEGVVEKIDRLELASPFFFWPRSALSRPVILEYLSSKGYRFHAPVLYDTFPNPETPIPDLKSFDEIIFTSPSVVDAFFKRVREVPSKVCLTPIGPVTGHRLKSHVVP